MSEKCIFYGTAKPGGEAAVTAMGFAAACDAYRVDHRSELYRTGSPKNTSGGVMVIRLPHTSVSLSLRLAEAIISECRARSFSAVRLESARKNAESAAVLADLLAGSVPVYIRAGADAAAKSAVPVYCGAVTSGTFKGYVRSLCYKYGAPALDITAVCADAALPITRNGPAPLNDSGLKRLLLERGTAAFKSEPLMLNYATYVDGAEAHAVLFDDGRTIRMRMKAAAALGVSAVFVSEGALRLLRQSPAPPHGYSSRSYRAEP